jgi:hypothetical protein
VCTVVACLLVMTSDFVCLSIFDLHARPFTRERVQTNLLCGIFLVLSQDLTLQCAFFEAWGHIDERKFHHSALSVAEPLGANYKLITARVRKYQEEVSLCSPTYASKSRYKRTWFPAHVHAGICVSSRVAHPSPTTPSRCLKNTSY